MLPRKFVTVNDQAALVARAEHGGRILTTLPRGRFLEPPALALPRVFRRNAS